MKKDTRDRREYRRNRYLMLKDIISEKKKIKYKEDKEHRQHALKKANEYYKNNKETVKQRSKNFYYKNKNTINSKRRSRYDPEKAKIENKKYRIENPEKIRANTAKYKASKGNSVPKWLTKEHKKEIRAFYKKRLDLTSKTGIEHQVDHIVPLRGENVCGLHVPWNLQILTKTENIRKNNRFDMVLFKKYVENI